MMQGDMGPLKSQEEIYRIANARSKNSVDDHVYGPRDPWLANGQVVTKD